MIQRKVSLVPTLKEKGSKKKEGVATGSTTHGNGADHSVNPVLAGILQRNKRQGGDRSKGSSVQAVPPSPPTKIAQPSSLATPQELARAAAGRGVRHSFGAAAVASSAAEPVGLHVNTSLSQLELNFRSSFNDLNSNSLLADADADPTPLDEMMAPHYGFLSRNSSLIDLAMIPAVDDNEHPSTNPDTFGLNFDFPDPDHRKPAPTSDPSQRMSTGVLEDQATGPCR